MTGWQALGWAILTGLGGGIVVYALRWMVVPLALTVGTLLLAIALVTGDLP